MRVCQFRHERNVLLLVPSIGFEPTKAVTPAAYEAAAVDHLANSAFLAEVVRFELTKGD